MKRGEIGVEQIHGDSFFVVMGKPAILRGVAQPTSRNQNVRLSLAGETTLIAMVTTRLRHECENVAEDSDKTRPCLPQFLHNYVPTV